MTVPLGWSGQYLDEIVRDIGAELELMTPQELTTALNSRLANYRMAVIEGPRAANLLPTLIQHRVRVTVEWDT